MGVDISIIVPVYNTGKYLSECVGSIIAQTIFNQTEVILVNDGSSDHSPQICNEYAQKYKNISVIHQNNAGVSAARNNGMKRAEGKYIGFVDSDDYIHPEMFERLFKLAEETNADMSFCGFVFCYPEGENKTIYPFPENKILDKNYIQSEIYTYMLKEEMFNSCWNKLFRKTIIEEKLLQFPIGRKNGEDRQFLFDYLANSNSLCYVPNADYYYRIVQNSATQELGKNYLDIIIAGYKEDLIIFKDLGFKIEVIEYNSGLKLLKHTLSGMHFAAKKSTGKDRRAAIKEIINNSEIRHCLKKNWSGLIKSSSRYEKILYFMLKIKCITGIRLAMSAMQLRISFARGEAK